MLKVRIADNAFTQQNGLMWVESMPEDHGMLFDFKRPQPLSFWGMNTFIPLDIAFVNHNKKIVKIDKIEPNSLIAIYSGTPCVYAIEANSGYFKKAGITVGDIMELKYSAPRTANLYPDIWDGPFISFTKSEEGLTVVSKENTSRGLRSKESQIDPAANERVNKPNSTPIGEPVTQDGTTLPVLDVQDLGRILEDSFDEGENAELQPEPEEQNVPSEEEQQKYPVFKNAFEATDWAEKSNEVVRISYTTKHGRQLVRDVEPHGKFHSDSTNKMILVTFDETIGDIRAFIVGNITSWAFTGKKFNKRFVVKA
jgi:uncharacterized membrane protein (UPF0127 family)